MRIVAGQLRRRKLLVNPGTTTRPITDRAKVMLFDYIRDFMPGQSVLDVFSGTGSLGFEALSRGAKSAVFCEQDVEDRTLCWRTDCLRCSFKARGDEGWYPYGVIFFDPPYEKIKQLKVGSPMYRSLLRLARDELSITNALLVLRTPTESVFEIPNGWQRQRVVSVSGMDMHLFRKQAVAEPMSTDDETDSGSEFEQ